MGSHLFDRWFGQKRRGGHHGGGYPGLSRGGQSTAPSLGCGAAHSGPRLGRDQRQDRPAGRLQSVGIRTDPVVSALMEADARKAELDQMLATAPLPPVRLHLSQISIASALRNLT